jgi:hypothetical protein
MKMKKQLFASGASLIADEFVEICQQAQQQII